MSIEKKMPQAKLTLQSSPTCVNSFSCTLDTNRPHLHWYPYQPLLCSGTHSECYHSRGTKIQLK